MGLFSKKYIYVDVCFLHGQHPYTYRTNDSSIAINTVVMVPAGTEMRLSLRLLLKSGSIKKRMYRSRRRRLKRLSARLTTPTGSSLMALICGCRWIFLLN